MFRLRHLHAAAVIVVAALTCCVPAAAQQTINGAIIRSGTLPLSSIAQSSAAANDVPMWNGSAWVPATILSGDITTGYITVVDTANATSLSGTPFLDGVGTAAGSTILLTDQYITVTAGTSSTSFTSSYGALPVGSDLAGATGTSANIGASTTITAVSGTGPYTYTVSPALPATPAASDTFDDCQDGPWVVQSGGGAWQRPFWYPSAAIINYANPIAFVTQGSAYGQTRWMENHGPLQVDIGISGWQQIDWPYDDVVTSVTGPSALLTWAFSGNTETASLASQSANRVFAGPASGSAAAPTFRALTAADMPSSGAGSGTLTSVGASGPSSILTWTGSPVTSSGTLTASAASTPANEVMAGPSSGSSAAWGPRSLVNADLPTSGVSAGSYTNASVTVNAQGIVTSASNGSGGSGSLPDDYISGCQLVYDSTTAIQVNTGTVGLASGSSYTVTSTITDSPSLSASTMYYVYLTSASAVTVSTSAPSTNYAGTAWDDGTTSHRYVGAFLTNSSSQIINFRRVGNIVRYKTDIFISQFEVVSSSATTSTSASCSSIVPATSYQAVISAIIPGSDEVYFGTSDGTTPTSTSGDTVLGGSGGVLYVYGVINLNSSTAFLFCNESPQSSKLYIAGYLEDR